MTVIVSMLLYIFGLDAATGTLNYKCENNITKCGNGITIDTLGNIIIYDPNYNPAISPVYYQSPNIIVPNPNTSYNDIPQSKYVVIPSGSSSPSYQS
jgi:hypothetical protein